MEVRPEALICAWCGKTLQTETACLVKAQTVVGLPENEGAFVPLALTKSGRTITGFFVTSDSPAKRAGIDVLFSTCGEECASALKAAVWEEVDLGLIIG